MGIYGSLWLRNTLPNGQRSYKATGGAIANFIKENGLVQFGVPHRIISDNDTPFVNREVRKTLEFY